MNIIVCRLPDWKLEMNVVLDGSKITSSDDFYRQLAAGLDLHSYGRNLDALWDLLSASVERPLSISWVDSERSRDVLREEFQAIVAVLDRVVEFDRAARWPDKFHYTLL
ncbi:barstar family protein [Luteibacter sp.]|jgi:ribonuclease inhibitor|uniref:barstar family protein n=1 Tax=Luteibacter sp. TaxID=1886636 RepID=UPI0039C9DC61